MPRLSEGHSGVPERQPEMPEGHLGMPERSPGMHEKGPELVKVAQGSSGSELFPRSSRDIQGSFREAQAKLREISRKPRVSLGQLQGKFRGLQGKCKESSEQVQKAQREI